MVVSWLNCSLNIERLIWWTLCTLERKRMSYFSQKPKISSVKWTNEIFLNSNASLSRCVGWTSYSLNADSFEFYRQFKTHQQFRRLVNVWQKPASYKATTHWDRAKSRSIIKLSAFPTCKLPTDDSFCWFRSRQYRSEKSRELLLIALVIKKAY